MANNQNVNQQENPDFGYYDDTEILPTIDISKFNRRELKDLARTIAGRSNHRYGVTYDEVLNNKVNVQGKFSRQEDRFKRLVKKQYDKNVLHTQQIERAKRAGQGDVKAMQDYITTGTNSAAPYFIPVVLAPAAAAAATSGALGTAVQGIGNIMSKGWVRWPLEALGAGDFIYRNATGQGVKKTFDKFREGDFWGGVGNATLDILDATGIAGAGYDIYKASKLPGRVKLLKKTLRPWARSKKANQLYRELADKGRLIVDKRQQLNVDYNQAGLTPPELKAAVKLRTQTVDQGIKQTSVPFTLPNGKVINIETAVNNTGIGTTTYPVLGNESEIIMTPVIKGGHPNSWFLNSPQYVGPPGYKTTTGLQNIPIQVKPNPEFSKYVAEAQQAMGNSGIVGGSSVLFDRGYISGVPHDLEIITTKSRQADLIKNIGFDEASATKLPLALSSKSKISADRGLTDIQMIDEDANGFAIGKLAHELYRILHPEDHAEYISALAKQHFNNPGATAETFKLPKKGGGFYTANELLDEFLLNGAMTKKTLVDALSVDKTGAGYSGVKLMRPIGILSNTDPTLQPEILDAIHTLGKINLGKDYKTIRDLYPNIDFTNIQKNEEFLKALGFDPSLASNPQAMENIAEYFHLQLSGSQRVYHSPKSPEDVERFAFPTKDWGGGRVAGAGGNSTIGTDAAFDYPFRSMGLFPVTKSGEAITSPLDILQAYKSNSKDTLLASILTDSAKESLQKLGLNIHDKSTLGDIDLQLAQINEESVTEAVGNILGINGLFGGTYRSAFGTPGGIEYFGRYSKKPVASSYRLVALKGSHTPTLNYEMGRLLHKYKETNQINGTNEETLLFMDSMRDVFEDFLSGKITEHTGVQFSRNDYDKILEFKKEFEALNAKERHNFHKQLNISDLENKYVRLGRRIDQFLRNALLAGTVGAGALGSSYVIGQAVKQNRGNLYFDEYSNTDEYKNSYYHQLQKDPRFSYKNHSMTDDEYKHLRNAWKELVKATNEYGKRRHKENRKAVKENFLKQFSEFQPNDLGYLMHGK